MSKFKRQGESFYWYISLFQYCLATRGWYRLSHGVSKPGEDGRVPFAAFTRFVLISLALILY